MAFVFQGFVWTLNSLWQILIGKLLIHALNEEACHCLFQSGDNWTAESVCIYISDSNYNHALTGIEIIFTKHIERVLFVNCEIKNMQACIKYLDLNTARFKSLT